MVGSAIDNPNPDGNEFWLTQQLATTYADIVNREPLRTATMAALGMTWLPGYTAKVVRQHPARRDRGDRHRPAARAGGGERAGQTAGPDQPDRARARGPAAAELHQPAARRPGSEHQATKDEIDKKQTDLANMFSARQIADTQTQISGLQNKLTTLQANYAALLANTQRGALNSISIIEEAALPTVPVGPQKMATILLAAAIGLILLRRRGLPDGIPGRQPEEPGRRRRRSWA